MRWALYQRDDDTEATAVKRLEVYEAQTKPLVEYYRGAPAARRDRWQSVYRRGDQSAPGAIEQNL